MGRTIVRPAGSQRNRKSRDAAVTALFAVVLAFAVLGLVSAVVFAAGHLGTRSAAPAAPKTHNAGHTTGYSQAATDIARAQAQATAVVKAANDASSSIIKMANSRAHRQAAAIIAGAKRQAAAVSPAQSSTGQSTAPLQSSTTGTTQSTAPLISATPAPTAVLASGSSTPNLSSLPASWLVVGYNATFGSGPGSAGGISVINRSAHTFSGVATVRYHSGQVATASFSGLAPGRSLTLPLNGPVYTGGGYTISLTGLH